MDDFFKSKKWVAAIGVIFGLCLLLAAFEAGVSVGFHKASFADRIGGDYYRVFGRGGAGPLGSLDQDDMPASHGVVGTIIRLEPPYAFIKGPNNVERAIHLDASTTVLKFRDNIGPAGLIEGDLIVVIGTPEASSSEIDAHLVRVLPPPTTNGSTINQ